WRQCENPQPEKSCYITLSNAYHGDTIGCVSAGGVERFHAMFKPLLFETISVPSPCTYRMPEGVTSDGLLAHHLGLLENVLKDNHHHTAAMVIEPLVQGAAGMIVHPRGYLRGARELTERYDVLLIADEVAVGMGRTGRMFACEHEDVTPDMMCIAKGITGGYMPLAATVTTPEIWNAFIGDYAEGKTFFHGHTYGGNPLGAAVALATLEVFEEEQTLDNLRPKIARLGEHLERISHLKDVGNVRQCGMIGAVELVRDRETKEPFPWEEKRGIRVCDHARGEGVLLRPLGNVLVLMPPLSVTLEELDRIADAVYRGIEATSQNKME
ncbi:MAG: aminotransferase class III-fold pyridoxal phosphate-dependent enzyme, partial [Pirellulales bacterium]|nr:aminotransferase class III-fold pyridoxal phosphate-dependent enzyme [Pirellulales bacterium]